jgi:hypothetical protein
MHPIEQLRFVARAGGADARLLVEEAASALTTFRRDHRALVMACRRLVDRQPAVAPLWWLCSRLVTTGDVAAEVRSIVLEVRNDPTSASLAGYLERLAGLASSDDGPVSHPDCGVRVAIAGWPDVVVAGIIEASDRPSSVDFGVSVLDLDGDGPAVVRHLDRNDIEAGLVDPAGAAAAARSADLIVVEALATNGRLLAIDGASAALSAAALAAGIPVCCVVPAGRALYDQYLDAVLGAGESHAFSPSPLPAIEEVSMELVDTVITGDNVLTRSGPTEPWMESVHRALTPAWPMASELLH